MTNSTLRRVKLIYKIILSLLLITCGILLMFGCVKIYQLGDRPFTTENIANAFGKIRIPIYITLAAIVGGIVLWLCFPDERKKQKNTMSPLALAARLEARIDRERCDSTLLATIQREKVFRRRINFIVALSCIEILLPAAVYIMKFDAASKTFAHFDMEYNAAIIAACVWLMPALCIIAGFMMLRSHLEHSSAKLQLEAVKTALAAQGKALPVEKAAVKKTRTLLIVRIIVFVAAVAMIVAGVANGGMADVLAKAIAICTECIGLG